MLTLPLVSSHRYQVRYMKKKKRLPTGSKFLPHTSRNKLAKMQKEETDPKAQMRLLMCIARKDGKSIRQIARVQQVILYNMCMVKACNRARTEGKIR